MWSENEEQCFGRLKTLHTVLYDDARPYANGAVIAQEEHPTSTPRSYYKHSRGSKITLKRNYYH